MARLRYRVDEVREGGAGGEGEVAALDQVLLRDGGRGHTLHQAGHLLCLQA